MDNSIQNKFIMNILNVDDKDIDTLQCVDDENDNITVYVTLNKNRFVEDKYKLKGL